MISFHLCKSLRANVSRWRSTPLWRLQANWAYETTVLKVCSLFLRLSVVAWKTEVRRNDVPADLQFWNIFFDDTFLTSKAFLSSLKSSFHGVTVHYSLGQAHVISAFQCLAYCSCSSFVCLHAIHHFLPVVLRFTLSFSFLWLAVYHFAVFSSLSGGRCHGLCAYTVVLCMYRLLWKYILICFAFAIFWRFLRPFLSILSSLSVSDRYDQMIHLMLSLSSIFIVTFFTLSHLSLLLHDSSDAQISPCRHLWNHLTLMLIVASIQSGNYRVRQYNVFAALRPPSYYRYQPSCMTFIVFVNGIWHI